ncbi:thiamine phosphate synthase [Terricaulis sp.]|uniref:thiamine phosphate synthase n=1 Tax=Terricaulis sp. TaxID=2768686 RepID=UPI003784C528
MGSASVLAALARRLNLEAGAPPIPSLYFLTDPERTPHPERIARSLPRGTAIIYRHYGAAERLRVARDLKRIAASRGLFLLIAADPALARRVGADGVHWPEQRLPARPERMGLTTAAAHSGAAIARAAGIGVDAILLSPVFPSESASGRPPLGAIRAAQLARASPTPVIALGGITARTGARLMGRGYAGIAAVEALATA